MIISSGCLDISLESGENDVNIVCIENVELYRHFYELSLFDKTIEYFLLFIEEGKKLDSGKIATIINDPILFDINSRPVLSKVYADIGEVAAENMIENLFRIQEKHIEFLDTVSNMLTYDISYDLDFKTDAILKLHNVKLMDDSESSIDRLITYIKIAGRLLRLYLICIYRT